MGKDFSAFHAASCLACLPKGSALLALYAPESAWTDAELMLHGLAQAFAGKEIKRPWETGGNGNGLGFETRSVPIDQFEDWYENTKWKEVDDWQAIR